MVLGRSPVVLPALPAPGALPPATTFVLVGSPEAAPWLQTLFPSLAAKCFTGWESHCAALAPSALPGGYYTGSVLVAAGQGARGGIFGAYAFCEEVLGVNPLKLFTDDPPSYAGDAGVAVDAALGVFFAPPRWRWRGAFCNDEDILANHWPDTLGQATMDSRAYGWLIETLLRLKGNVLLPATNPFPDQDVYAQASARGLAVTHHHYDLLGGNVFGWPLPSTDWNYDKDPGTMASLWRSAIDAQAALPEVLWSVGLRGLNDYPYPCSTPAECGGLISAAMGNQTQWIRSAQPNATILLYLWQEALSYLTDGYLIVPEGVTVVFTDSGQGYINVDSDWKKYCQGVYC